MPSFDIVSRVEMQEVENALNNTRKEIATRYDFQRSKTEVTFDKKEKKIHVVTDDSMKMDAVKEMLLKNFAKRKVDLRSLQFEDPTPTAHAALKRDVLIKEGIEKDIAKQIVAIIKESKIKVQASIQGDELRVSGKQIDDLQSVMSLLKGTDLPVGLQFLNLKS